MNIALILSGGTGTRLGASMPKQYIEVDGQMIISYCLMTFCKHPMIDAVQIVADSAWVEIIEKEIEKLDIDSKKIRGFSKPGITRQMSIFHGMEDILDWNEEDVNIIIHDAARPNLTGDLISECLNGLQEHDGVLPVLPMKDTIYVSDDGKKVNALIDRSTLYAGQAPEAFKLKYYYQANRALLPDEILTINGSTEPAIKAGLDIALIQGEESNYKITTKADLIKFERERNESICTS